VQKERIVYAHADERSYNPGRAAEEEGIDDSLPGTYFP